MIFWRRSNKFATIVLWTIFSVAIFPLLVTFTGINKILVAPLVRNETPENVTMGSAGAGKKGNRVI